MQLEAYLQSYAKKLIINSYLIKPLRKPMTVAKNMLNCENLNTFLKIGNKSRIFAFTTSMQVCARSITQ